MSTRCSIGYQTQSGDFLAIECTHDGYILGGVGQWLLADYNSLELARDLVSKGSVDGLDGMELEEFYPGDNAPKNVGTTLESAISGATSEFDSEFIYFFVDGQWRTGKSGMLLSDALNKVRQIDDLDDLDDRAEFYESI